MITSPIILMGLALTALLVFAVYTLHVAQLCSDKAQGIVRSDRPVRALQAQQARAERTTAWAFGLAFLVAMAMVGTMEFSLL